MKHHTADEKLHQVRARSLLADILGAPLTALPRRDTLVDWLNALILRADQRGYVMESTETDDLTALDKHLRSYEVPVAAVAV